MIAFRPALRDDVPAVLALLADAEARARAAGCNLLQLTSNASREGALRFYEGLGFTPSHIGFKRELH